MPKEQVMANLTPFILWEDDKRQEIKSVEELDLFLDKLTIEGIKKACNSPFKLSYPKKLLLR